MLERKMAFLYTNKITTTAASTTTTTITITTATTTNKVHGIGMAR
jgi:hypothetical protein